MITTNMSSEMSRLCMICSSEPAQSLNYQTYLKQRRLGHLIDEYPRLENAWRLLEGIVDYRVYMKIGPDFRFMQNVTSPELCILCTGKLVDLIKDVYELTSLLEKKIELQPILTTSTSTTTAVNSIQKKQSAAIIQNAKRNESVKPSSKGESTSTICDVIELDHDDNTPTQIDNKVKCHPNPNRQVKKVMTKRGHQSTRRLSLPPAPPQEAWVTRDSAKTSQVPARLSKSATKSRSKTNQSSSSSVPVTSNNKSDSTLAQTAQEISAEMPDGLSGRPKRTRGRSLKERNPDFTGFLDDHFKEMSNSPGVPENPTLPTSSEKSAEVEIIEKNSTVSRRSSTQVYSQISEKTSPAQSNTKVPANKKASKVVGNGQKLGPGKKESSPPPPEKRAGGHKIMRIDNPVLPTSVTVNANPVIPIAKLATSQYPAANSKKRSVSPHSEVQSNRLPAKRSRLPSAKMKESGMYLPGIGGPNKEGSGSEDNNSTGSKGEVQIKRPKRISAPLPVKKPLEPTIDTKSILMQPEKTLDANIPDWKTAKFRCLQLAKLDSVLMEGKWSIKSGKGMEETVFKSARNKEDYLTGMTKLVAHFGKKTSSPLKQSEKPKAGHQKKSRKSAFTALPLPTVDLPTQNNEKEEENQQIEALSPASGPILIQDTRFFYASGTAHKEQNSNKKAQIEATSDDQNVNQKVAPKRKQATTKAKAKVGKDEQSAGTRPLPKFMNEDEVKGGSKGGFDDTSPDIPVPHDGLVSGIKALSKSGAIRRSTVKQKQEAAEVKDSAVKKQQGAKAVSKATKRKSANVSKALKSPAFSKTAESSLKSLEAAETKTNAVKSSSVNKKKTSTATKEKTSAAMVASETDQNVTLAAPKASMKDQTSTKKIPTTAKKVLTSSKNAPNAAKRAPATTKAALTASKTAATDAKTAPTKVVPIADTLDSVKTVQTKRPQRKSRSIQERNPDFIIDDEIIPLKIEKGTSKLDKEDNIQIHTNNDVITDKSSDDATTNKSSDDVIIVNKRSDDVTINKGSDDVTMNKCNDDVIINSSSDDVTDNNNSNKNEADKWFNINQD